MSGAATASGSVGRYALVTAAYNEAFYIERLLASVVHQTVLPAAWVVVSDASTDGTDAIVMRYAEQYSFVRLHRIEASHDRNFAAQVYAINAGFAQLDPSQFEFIGNLDADISLDSFYFERLIATMRATPELGLCGGWIHEKQRGEFRPRPLNNACSVAHGVQFFRQDCFRAFGAYLPLPYGGPDWHAEVTARMNGWRVESFTDLPAFHHRPTGTASGILRYCFRQGLMDFALGSDPLFETVKLARRLRQQPRLLAAFVRLAGFVWGFLRQEPRPVSKQFVDFLRREQRGRVWGVLRPSRRLAVLR